MDTHSEEDETRRISFMGKECAPHKSMVMTVRTQPSTTDDATPSENSPELATLMSQESALYHSYMNTLKRDEGLKETDTFLLKRVRERSRELSEEGRDKALELARDDDSDTHSSEACGHGWNIRMTDRSISRRSISRISRVSTRRDMDIPSILAFSATVAPAPTPLNMPVFQKTKPAPNPNIPRWSIRRSICPVCSQKWKDKSSISNIKYSGLKRNTSADMPSVIASARLRSSITTEYVPKPVMAVVDENKGVGMRNTDASWQLTRARRFRTPKLQMPSPESIAPPGISVPTAQKDLDNRVQRFLKDEGMTK